MQRVRSRLARVPWGWWVALLVLPALAPLARPGFFESHDGVFHAYRLAALDRAVRAGVLYPRWFPEFAFGYGHPVLNFYGPLSYYWGLPFTLLGADAIAATKLVLATGLVASALGLYAFARLYLDRLPALVAALVYAYLPYHLLDLYVRAALAEFLAFVWFPLILLAFHRLLDEAEGGRWIPWLAVAGLSLAALVLTHSLSALIFAPVLGAYVLLRLAARPGGRSLGRLLLALALAAALSAFYWLPVLAESQYVGLASGASEGYQRHLLPLAGLFSPDLAYRYEVRDPVTFPLGWVQGVIPVAVRGLPFLRRLRGPAILSLAVALISAWMLTTSSLPAWRALEGGLAFLQYPWRFQAMTVLATAMLAGLLLQALAGAPRPVAPLAAVRILALTGAWALAVTPVYNSYYRGTYLGATGLLGNSSANALVRVANKVAIKLNKNNITLGTTVVFSGAVAPNKKGQYVYLQALIAGKWKNVRYVKLTTTSLYAFAWKPSSRVDYKFRVVKPADTLNYTGVSPVLTLVVK